MRTGKEKALLGQIAKRTLPTNMWLARHGWEVCEMCGCGQHDDFQHRVRGCHVHTRKHTFGDEIEIWPDMVKHFSDQ